MAKPKIPNQKKKYQELDKRLKKYVMLVEKIYDTLNLEAAKTVSRTTYDAESGKPFKWSDYPQTKAAVDKLQSQFVDEMGAVIYRGTSEEWKESNLVQDLVADKVLRAYGAQVRGEKYKVFYQTNSDALKAFQKRKDNGMNVSAKLWNQSKDYKDGLEAAISCAIKKGTSAITLSKQISKYLIDFQSLQKDYKRMYGKAADIKDCEYRSARLARSEINMAYRTAEQTRWQQFDFVVGYEIKLSGSHRHRMPHGDICDTLAGKYPKTFKWTGWHPNDLCYVVSILKTEEEFWKWDDEKGHDTGSVNEVKDVPDDFKQWIGTNSQRIKDAEKKGTLPYFIKDNKKLVDDILSGTPVGKYYFPDVTDAKSKAKWSANGIETEKKLGIKCGDPMSFEEANELRGNINYVPKYLTRQTGAKYINPGYTDENNKYHVNCQSCVVANELRRRGYDVTAMPNLEVNGNLPYELSLKTEMAWIDPVTGDTPVKKRIGGRTISKGGLKVVAKSKGDVIRELNESTKEPGRYHINWGWRGRNSGHIVTFERFSNGKCQWYDPQNGSVNFFTGEKYKQIDISNGMYILRVDNLLVNNDIIHGIVEKFGK